MAAYATRRDVYTYGLPRGTLGMPARLIESALASTDTLTLDGHGFDTDDEVIVRAAEGGTLASPLVAGTVYYVIRLSDSTFKLAATAGGAAIGLTTDGESMYVAAPLPFDDVLEFYSRFADGFFPGHIVPFESPYPVFVTGIVAQLAAKKLMALAGHESASVDAAEVAAKAQLERMAKGLVIRDASATASANLAVVTTMGDDSDPRGWGSGSLP